MNWNENGMSDIDLGVFLLLIVAAADFMALVIAGSSILP